MKLPRLYNLGCADTLGTEGGLQASQSVHPLYRALAKLEGLKLVRFGSSEHKVYKIVNNRFSEYYNSESISEHYTYNISEYFAELYTLNILNPEILTPVERRFFDKLHRGLMVEGERFLASVARNPNILLDGTTSNMYS